MKITDAEILPAPEIEDATKSILFLASNLAHGTHAGAKYEIYQAGTTFGLTVTQADGTTIREHMKMKALLEAWVSDAIGRRPSPDECDHTDTTTVSTEPDRSTIYHCSRCGDSWYSDEGETQ